MWNIGKMGAFNLFYRGVQGETDFLIVFAQYFVLLLLLLLFLLITGLCFCMVQTHTKMICVNYRFSCFPPLTCAEFQAWIYSSLSQSLTFFFSFLAHRSLGSSFCSL